MAISHMVVGLCSVTILPLASTYVCQERAAMTSSSSAHLASPPSHPSPVRGARWGAGRGGGRRAGYSSLASRLSDFCTRHPVGVGTKCQPASGTAHQTPALLGEAGGGGGERRREAGGNYSCLRANKMYSCIRGDSLPNSHKQKNTCAHAHRRAQRHAKHALGHSQSNESSQLGSPSPGRAVFLQSERPC